MKATNRHLMGFDLQKNFDNKKVVTMTYLRLGFLYVEFGTLLLQCKHTKEMRHTHQHILRLQLSKVVHLTNNPRAL